MSSNMSAGMSVRELMPRLFSMCLAIRNSHTQHWFGQVSWSSCNLCNDSCMYGTHRYSSSVNSFIHCGSVFVCVYMSDLA